MLENLNLLARRTIRFLKTGSIATREMREYFKFVESSLHSYQTAFFNLTIDLELAWSRARRGDTSTTPEESLKRARRAREAFPCLIEMTKQYGIPITVAFVAHVAISDCTSHRIPPKFKPSWIKSDWFSIDPKTNLEKDKNYYGFDLVRMALESGVGHEIASHGFSHLDLGDSETTKEVAEYEITESYRILKQIDHNLSTFIFPKNNPGFVELLNKAGYAIYRGRDNKIIAKDNFGLWYFPRGLWLSPRASSPKEINELISLAIQKKQVVNLWCHLYEFENIEQLRKFFIPIFEFVKQKLDDGSLEVGTIRSIIANINNEQRKRILQ